MIGVLKDLFEMPARGDEESQKQRLHVAAAALLIETARADFTEDAVEQTTMKDLLSNALDLDEQQVRDLVQAAVERVDEATSLYEFTRVINDHYSAEQKLQLVDAMWAVAYADDNLDKYEEHLIRQVAELTYVPHQDYIRSKLAVNST